MSDLWFKIKWSRLGIKVWDTYLLITWYAGLRRGPYCGQCHGRVHPWKNRTMVHKPGCTWA